MAPVHRSNTTFKQRDADGNKIDNFHLILLAQNEQGLRNLWAINSEAHGTGFYRNGRVDWELLKKYNEGMICTSACALGIVQQGLDSNPHAGDPYEVTQRFLDVFGDRFYLELSTYPMDFQYKLNNETVSLSRQLGVPLVYANDAHYSTKEEYDLHEVYLTMQYQQKVKDVTEPHHCPALYIMDEDDVRQHIAYLGTSVVDEAIANSDRIGKLCSATPPEFKQRLPMFVPDGYKSSRDMIYDLAVKGYEAKVPAGCDDIYLPRFQKEMEVIFKSHLYDYFLMVRDYIQYAKEEGYLVGSGRGSVGGSLVAWLLDITQVDPIRYGLIFERFYNAGREKSMPDIDTDFPTHVREKIKKFLAQKYGQDYVADIGNVLTMRGKSAIQKVGMTLSVPKPQTDAISGIIETAIESGLQPNWEGIWDHCGTELQPYKDKYPKLFEIAEELYDHVFSYGVHASGVIIGDEPLKYVCPMRWVPNEKKLVTQFDYRTAEKLGFQKVDLLGLRNLNTLQELNNILIESGRDPIAFDESLQNMKHPEEMWELMDRGLTIGLFQIEDGKTAKQLARDIKPRSIEDLAIITALNRPGPLIAGADKRYISGRNGNTPLYIHDLVEKVTPDTFGEFIYQEQVIKFFQEIGYSLMEADDVRSIMGKKLREKMQEEFPRYIERATKYMPRSTAEKVWGSIENFSKYAFNKAHSVGYGIILLWTLYAKYHYPTEFILAGIRTVDKDVRHKWVEEAQRMGIEILPPELNKSMVKAAIDGNKIRYGYSDVKGVGVEAAQWLHKYGPWRDWAHVAERAQDEDTKKTLPSGQKRVVVNAGHISTLRKFSETTDKHERLTLEEDLLGVAISDDSVSILLDYEKEIAKECVKMGELQGPGDFNIAGIIKEIREAKTKKGTPMAWVKLSDGTELVEVAVWNTELDRLRFIWHRRTAVLAKVKVTEDNFVSLIGAKILHKKR